MLNGKFVGLLAAVAALAAVIAGLYLSGSPGEQRLLRLDEQRVQDLRAISHNIDTYRTARDALPQDLDILVETQRLRRLPVDPVTGARYEYEIVAEDDYRLCAEFDRPSPPSAAIEDFWLHPRGRQCFALSARPSASGLGRP